ncbi:hypothetical protein Dform_00583 [Dehalogenimonas formicexedens]|uniref:Uncharacterized protein n=1 Tax=Dehalogenimonas formicexedens TaxID=1839801 RepID=A0A1P8F670_9CHLR|nr:DUF6544 family protein [Dehalogenimonas formicexedens]APV43938.1 hypothetical protein Dform_00583 [Dehalogenimonas formicexedens]
MIWLMIFLVFDLTIAILMALLIGRGSKTWNESRRIEIEKLNADAQPIDKIFDASAITNLPAPVRRYLTKSIKPGTPFVIKLHLKQTGQMRFNQRWIKIEGDQYYSVSPPAFNWLARMKLGPAWIAARDRYSNGKGNMLISILSTFPLFDVRGPEIDNASLLRYLSELPWLPTAFLSGNITWKEIDDRNAAATFTDNGVTASGIFHFNDDDEVVAFISSGRFRNDTGKMTPWSGTWSNYREFNGFRIPTEGNAVWNAPEGDFEYIRLKVETAEYK